MTELPCQVVLSLPDVHPLTRDCPLRCEVQSLKGFYSPSVSDGNSFIRDGGESRFLTGAVGRWGILLHPCGSGHSPWLILSWLCAEVGSVAQHTAILGTHELNPDVWFCPTVAPLHIQWSTQPSGRIKRFSVRLTKTHKAEMFSRFGPPLGEGEWLAVRLLPRRRPATLRVPVPGVATLFIPLDTI